MPPKAPGLVTNWQQGMSVIYFTDEVFNVYPIVITEGKCIFNREVHSG